MKNIGDVINSALADCGIPPLPKEPPAVVEESSNLPEVEIVPLISSMARNVGRVLAQKEIFVRQRSAFTISPEGELSEMTARRFRTYCDDHMMFFKWTNPKPDVHEKKPQTITLETAATILESDQFLNRQREILNVATVRQPVRRKDGRIELLPYGYDAESKIFTQNSGVEFAQDMPVSEARHVLREFLKEFPFGDRANDGTSRNESVVVASMLALFAAPLLGPEAKRLNFMLTSNSVGSGKTLLAQIAIITTHGSCDVQPVPAKEEDWRKILDTESMAGSSYILFDDCPDFFQSHSLNAFLTATTWTGRKMNSQQKFTVPQLATVFLTGNNLQVKGDLDRRVLHCKMAIEEADPQARKIEKFFDDQDLKRPGMRSQLLACLWSIVRSWDEAGRPKGKKEIRGYEMWSQYFGGMMIHAGFADPLEPLPLEESSNQELSDMMAIVDKLSKGVVSSAKYKFQEVVDAAFALGKFDYMLKGEVQHQGDLPRLVLDKESQSKFGKKLRNYKGRKFNLQGNRCVRFCVEGEEHKKFYIVNIENPGSLQ